MSSIGLLVAVLGFLASLALVVVGDLVSEEVRARLDHLPHAVLRLAIRRLPANLPADLGDEWSAELDHILHHATLYPLTRLVFGVRYAAGLLSKAPTIACSLGLIRSEGSELRRRATPGHDIAFSTAEVGERLPDDDAAGRAEVEAAVDDLSPRVRILAPTVGASFLVLAAVVVATSYPVLYGWVRDTHLYANWGAHLWTFMVIGMFIDFQLIALVGVALRASPRWLVAGAVGMGAVIVWFDLLALQAADATPGRRLVAVLPVALMLLVFAAGLRLTGMTRPALFLPSRRLSRL